jgi:hypothetical protein
MVNTLVSKATNSMESSETGRDMEKECLNTKMETNMMEGGLMIKSQAMDLSSGIMEILIEAYGN